MNLKGGEMEQQIRAMAELRRLATIVRDSNDAITVQKFDGTITAWNRGAERMYGWREAEALGMNIQDIIPEVRRAKESTVIKYLALGEAVESYETQRVTKDGHTLDVWLTATVLVDEEDRPAAVATTERDVTARNRTEQALRKEIAERQRTEEALFQEKERAQITLHSIGDAVITTDAKGIVEYLNPVAEALTGWPANEGRGQLLESVFQIITEQTREQAPNPVSRCLLSGRIMGLANGSILISRSGQEYAIHDSAAPICSRDGQVLGAVLVFSDVTEMRRVTRQLVQQAAHDALTGLVNRREFERRLEHALESAKGQGIQHALCYLDLDRFKLINDSVGHVAGDRLLQQVSGLLRQKVRARDTLARLGGDEFSLLIEHCPLEKAVEIAKSLVATLRDLRFVWQSRSFEISVSVGVVPITSAVENTGELLAQVDVACYTAKDLGRNRVYVYHTSDPELARRHTEMLHIADLKGALQEGRFRLYCQPIVALSPSNDHLRYEFLLRLVDAQGESASPKTFIMAAERYGLMATIDRWVIRKALHHAAECHSLMAGIAINISGNSLNDEGLLAFVREVLAETVFPPERLCFEITETAAITNLRQATHFVTEMKKTGCRFALDDFGSGLSCFTYLKHLPVDYLKIDGSFVQGMLNDPIDRAMVAAIHQVGQTMGIRTIGECAENEAIVQELREIGVDFAQGNALGSPSPVEERE
jgi:diguanylate cyclase (GGDEF)-like protein/PAS domain S-box-containing protein